MAAAIAMDLDHEKAGKSSTAAALSINKSASKISKPSSSSSSSLRRNPSVVQQAKPMPTSKIYNTDPMGFRNLVQELTGYTPSTSASTTTTVTAASTATTATHDQSSDSPSSGSPGVHHQPSARPVNSRLQRMAPPPLRPTFSFSSFRQTNMQSENMKQSEVTGTGTGTATTLSSPGAHPLSPISKRVSPMPVLSFSPLPVLSPGDNAWNNFSFESPNTAAMKQLAQSIAEGKNTNGGGGFNGGRFPWSPTYGLGQPSPGLPVPELFPGVKMIDSPENVTGNGNNGNDFSFPEVHNT